jgi:hypothetical protein
MERVTIEDKLGVRQDQHAPRVAQLVFEDTFEGRKDQLTPKGVVTMIIKNKPLSIINQLILKVEQVVTKDKPPSILGFYLLNMFAYRTFGQSSITNSIEATLGFHTPSGR